MTDKSEATGRKLFSSKLALPVLILIVVLQVAMLPCLSDDEQNDTQDQADAVPINSREKNEKTNADRQSDEDTADDALPIAKPGKTKGEEKTHLDAKGIGAGKTAPQIPGYEVVKSFETSLRLRKDCSLDISETIAVDFNGVSRSGIYRMIPTRYNSFGNTFTMDVSVNSVTDQFGEPYPFEATAQDRDLIVRVGDRDRSVRGMHVYKLQYTIRRAVNFFGKQPQLYWNLTGNEWPFPIEHVKAEFFPPPGTTTDGIRATCRRSSGGAGTEVPVSLTKSGIVVITDELEPAEGLILNAYLPKGLVAPPPVTQQIVWWLKSWMFAFIIPAIVAALLFWQWYLTGGRLESLKTIVPQRVPPKDLTPSEVGALVDGRFDLKDIVAMLFDLACRGYLKIREARKEDYQFLSSRDYEFIRLPNLQKETSLTAHEQQFLQRLFDNNPDNVKLSELRGRFYKGVPEIGNGIYQSLTKRRYFKGTPDGVSILYIIVSLLLMLLAVFFLVKDLPIAVGIFASALIFLVMAPFMSAKTVAGADVLRDCIGFKRFVEMSERERIAKLAMDDANIFSKLLPYTMVLGVEQIWAENFRDLISKPPDWYEPWDYVRGYKYSTSELVDSIGQAIYLTTNTFSSKPDESPKVNE